MHLLENYTPYNSTGSGSDLNVLCRRALICGGGDRTLNFLGGKCIGYWFMV